jgi:hypothetical protein
MWKYSRNGCGRLASNTSSRFREEEPSHEGFAKLRFNRAFVLASRKILNSDGFIAQKEG